MLKCLMGMIGIGVLLWVGTPYAHGQKSAEIYIPLGQSPGLSAKVTIIGKIEAVNTRDRTIAIVGPSGRAGAKITEGTKIWLDRSKLRLTNQTGSFADLKQGLSVEVKYKDDERRGEGAAEWIKVEPAGPGAKSAEKGPYAG